MALISPVWLITISLLASPTLVFVTLQDGDSSEKMENVCPTCCRKSNFIKHHALISMSTSIWNKLSRKVKFVFCMSPARRTHVKVIAEDPWCVSQDLVNGNWWELSVTELDAPTLLLVSRGCTQMWPIIEIGFVRKHWEQCARQRSKENVMIMHLCVRNPTLMMMMLVTLNLNIYIIQNSRYRFVPFILSSFISTYDGEFKFYSFAF